MSLYVLAFLYAMGVWGLGLSVGDELVAQLTELGVYLVGEDVLLAGVDEPEEGPNFFLVLLQAGDFTLVLLVHSNQYVFACIHVFSIVGFYY